MCIHGHELTPLTENDFTSPGCNTGRTSADGSSHTTKEVFDVGLVATDNDASDTDASSEEEVDDEAEEEEEEVGVPLFGPMVVETALSVRIA